MVNQPPSGIFLMLVEHLKVTMTSVLGMTMLSEISVGRNTLCEVWFIDVKTPCKSLVKKARKFYLGTDTVIKSCRSETIKQCAHENAQKFIVLLSSLVVLLRFG